MSIVLENISKKFGQFSALDHIDLEIPEGELVALLGSSGCGKTTLLRIIAGLERPDEGKVLLSGEDKIDHDVRKRGIGFVFQHYADRVRQCCVWLAGKTQTVTSQRS
jgi:sulfate/thiosulfate transport system ATP-binding protein